MTRLLGHWGHDAAVAAGVRLVSINRPGYGGSASTTGAPSLLGVGRDTADLASHLGLASYAVFGSSGGGPFAAATAIADRGRVRALGVVGGVGPWRLLNDPIGRPGGPRVPGDDRCRRCRRDVGVLRSAGGGAACRVSPRQAADDLLASESSAADRGPGYRSIWEENWRLVQANLDGYVFDNVAWGGPWDIDPRDVAAPTLLFYGTVDPHCPTDRHGRWYADRIADSELVVRAQPWALRGHRWPLARGAGGSPANLDSRGTLGLTTRR